MYIIYLRRVNVGRAVPGVVANRVSRVSSVIDIAAARKIEVKFFYMSSKSCCP
jgi:hypothetical protein